MRAARADGSATGARQVADPPAEPSERQMTAAVVAAAGLTGWRLFHARPGLNRGGRWATQIQGDGVGFPDFVMVHPAAGLTWFVELKSRVGRLSLEQERWGADLIRAGEVFKVVRGRAGLTALLDDMAILPRVQP